MIKYLRDLKELENLFSQKLAEIAEMNMQGVPVINLVWQSGFTSAPRGNRSLALESAKLMCMDTRDIKGLKHFV
jgi:hypothetical protein